MAPWVQIQGKPHLALLQNAQTTEGFCTDPRVDSDKSDCKRRSTYGYSQNIESTQ